MAERFTAEALQAKHGDFGSRYRSAFNEEYDFILSLLPGRVVVRHDFGEYDGDSLLIFYDVAGYRWGFLCFGWGSCPGCDALQDTNCWHDFAKLANELADQTVWFEYHAGLVEWLANRDWESNYLYYVTETPQRSNRVDLRGFIGDAFAAKWRLGKVNAMQLHDEYRELSKYVNAYMNPMFYMLALIPGKLIMQCQIELPTRLWLNVFAREGKYALVEVSESDFKLNWTWLVEASMDASRQLIWWDDHEKMVAYMKGRDWAKGKAGQWFARNVFYNAYQFSKDIR